MVVIKEENLTTKVVLREITTPITTRTHTQAMTQTLCLNQINLRIILECSRSTRQNFGFQSAETAAAVMATSMAVAVAMVVSLRANALQALLRVSHKLQCRQYLLPLPVKERTAFEWKGV